MKPGLARAVPLGIVGFGVGALIAIGIRLLQGLDPNPDAPFAYVGSAMVLGAFLSAGFFIWGMGAFDPRMNVHGEHADEEAHEEAAETPESAMAVLGGFSWQILFWVTVMVVGVAAFAFLPSGPMLQAISGDGNPAEIGYASLGQIYGAVAQFGKDAAGIEIPPISAQLAAVQISYLVLFILFTLWTIFSLFALAGVLAYVFTYLSGGVRSPDRIGVPWRAVVLALIIGGLAQFPILAANMDVPMALLVPAYLIPVVALLVAYRHPLLILLLLVALGLPVLVPSVKIGNIWIAYNLLIVLLLEMLALRALKFLVRESAWRTISNAIYTITLAAALVISARAAWPDFWQIIFLIVVEIAIFLLLLPIENLKAIVPASVWNRFAAIHWLTVIPDFAHWLARFLREGLPQLLGQR